MTTLPILMPIQELARAKDHVDFLTQCL